MRAGLREAERMYRGARAHVWKGRKSGSSKTDLKRAKIYRRERVTILDHTRSLVKSIEGKLEKASAAMAEKKNKINLTHETRLILESRICEVLPLAASVCEVCVPA